MDPNSQPQQVPPLPEAPVTPTLQVQPQPVSPQQPPVQGAAPQSAPAAHPTDTNTIVVVLLLVFIYPVGYIAMWALMKRWPVWLKLVIGLPLVLVILSFAATLLLGFGTRRATQSALTKAQDVNRQSEILTLDTALRHYYTQHNSAPSSLSDLIAAGDISPNFFTPQTNQEITYKAADPVHGCVASISLKTTDETLYAYCK